MKLTPMILATFTLLNSGSLWAAWTDDVDNSRRPAEQQGDRPPPPQGQGNNQMGPPPQGQGEQGNLQMGPPPQGQGGQGNHQMGPPPQGQVGQGNHQMGPPPQQGNSMQQGQQGSQCPPCPQCGNRMGPPQGGNRMGPPHGGNRMGPPQGGQNNPIGPPPQGQGGQGMNLRSNKVANACGAHNGQCDLQERGNHSQGKQWMN